MIHVYRHIEAPAGGGEPSVEHSDFSTGEVIADDAVWIDAVSPSDEERQALESALWIFLPTREEASEIEPSSRLYREGEAIYLTVTALLKADSDTPQTTPITFVLTRERLLTLRYADPLPFKTFAQYVRRNPESCHGAQTTLAGLLDALIDRVADVLELQGAELDGIGRSVFARPGGGKPGGPKPGGRPGARDYTGMLAGLGRIADLTGKARESLSTIERALLYVSTVGRQELDRAAPGAKGGAKGDSLSKATQVRLKTLVRDVETLADYTDFLSGKADFLLNAVLGLIANDQNGIIKIISVVSVIIMPPTLIASIYGMNFRAMPELDWPFGYPLALLVMVVAALIPYLIFKRRGWL